MIRPWSPTALTAEERAGWLGHLERRYGIPPAAFDLFALVRANAKELALVPRALAAPAKPESMWQGLTFLHVNMADPKPTTAAAQLFGHLATRNVVPLDALACARAFLAREDLRPDPAQLARVTGPGWVIVTCGEHPLGVGQLRAGDPPLLLSQYPKAWAL